MKQVYEDLWETDMEVKFGTLQSHAYFLERKEGGNILFYTINNREELREITKKGGIDYQCMSHSHEVDDSLLVVKEELKPKLCCDALVKPYFNDSVSADIYFSKQDDEIHSNNIQVRHTKGHTNNSVCYLYKSPHGKNYLFVGDTIYLDHGKWNAFVFPRDGGNRDDLIKSLNHMRSLDVDVIIPSVSVGEFKIVETTNSEWVSIIDDVLNKI